MKATASASHVSKVHRGAFHSERELQDELVGLDLGLEGVYSITYYRRQVPVGACIPDLIYVRFSERPDPLLWPRRWTFRHSYAIWLLRRERQLTLHEIAARFYESPEGRIKQTMRDLIRSSAVTEPEPHTFTLTPAMRAVDAEVIAVEVKLSRWTRALEQAQDYLNFADRALVAMDATLLPKRTSVLDKFHELGIGLCAIVPKKLEWLIVPRPNNGRDGRNREYLISSAAAPFRHNLWSAL